MKKRVMIIWLVVLTVLAAMIIYSYNRDNPKYRYYFNDKRYTSERNYNTFHSYDGTFSDEALSNNKYFITPWCPKDTNYKAIISNGYSYGVYSSNSKKLYSEYCYLEDLYSIALNVKIVSLPLHYTTMFFNTYDVENENVTYSDCKLNGKYHMFGADINRILYDKNPRNIIHYEFDPSQKNMTFKTQYGYVDDVEYLYKLSDIDSGSRYDLPYDESKFKNVVNIEFTCERFDDNITITNIDNPNNIDITEEYLNNYKDLVKKHLDEYISVLNDVKEYFINKGMSYYKENVSIKNC